MCVDVVEDHRESPVGNDWEDKDEVFVGNEVYERRLRSKSVAGKWRKLGGHVCKQLGGHALRNGGESTVWCAQDRDCFGMSTDEMRRIDKRRRLQRRVFVAVSGCKEQL